METLKMKMEHGELLEEYLVELIDHDVRAPMVNFAYFLAISKGKSLAIEDTLNMMPLLQPFFSSSGFLLENLINWRRLYLHNEAEFYTKFYLKRLVKDILSSMNYLLIDKEIKVENKIAADTLCFGNQTAYTFVIKNLILSCLAYADTNSSLIIEIRNTAKGMSIVITGTKVFISEPILAILLDVKKHKKISAKDIGLLLSQQLLQYYGGALDIAHDNKERMIFTFNFGREIV